MIRGRMAVWGNILSLLIKFFSHTLIVSVSSLWYRGHMVSRKK